MNLRATHALSILLAFNFIVFLSACWYILCFFKTNLNICVITNPSNSAEINDKVKDLINSGLYKSRAIKIAEELKAIFPAIKSIEKISKGSCRKVIKVQTDLPVFMINNNRVITSGSKIISNSFYSPEFYENLNNFFLEDREVSPAEEALIFNFFKNLNPEVFEKYRIIWHNKTVITLLDKEDSFFYIKTEHETGFPEKLWESVNKIKDKVKTENSKSKKRKNSIWCADIRFGDKIVLTLKGEGEHEGQKFIK